MAFRLQRAEAVLARLQPALRCTDITPRGRVIRLFQTAGASLLYRSGLCVLSAALVGNMAAVESRWLGSIVGCLRRPSKNGVPFTSVGEPLLRDCDGMADPRPTPRPLLPAILRAWPRLAMTNKHVGLPVVEGMLQPLAVERRTADKHGPMRKDNTHTTGEEHARGCSPPLWCHLAKVQYFVKTTSG